MHRSPSPTDRDATARQCETRRRRGFLRTVVAAAGTTPPVSLAGCQHGAFGGGGEQTARVVIESDAVVFEPRGTVVEGQLEATEPEGKHLEDDDSFDPAAGVFALTGDGADVIGFREGTLQALAFNVESDVGATVVRSGDVLADGTIQFSKTFDLSTPTPQSETRVSADGDGDYSAIQPAVDAAKTGHIIHVAEGQYEEAVTIGTSVEIAANGGAVLDGSSLTDAAAFTIEGDAVPTLDGFDVRNYEAGVSAKETTGAWTVSGLVVEDVDNGIKASNSTGAWTVRETVLRGAHSDGIMANHSTGAWSVVDTAVVDSGNRGLAVWASDGDWTVTRTRVTGNDAMGFGGYKASGDWTVTDSVVADNGGLGVKAEATSGEWTVQGSIIVDNDRAGVMAFGASPQGDATRNWWGQPDGPSRGQCTGNADCSDPLSERP